MLTIGTGRLRTGRAVRWEVEVEVEVAVEAVAVCEERHPFGPRPPIFHEMSAGRRGRSTFVEPCTEDALLVAVERPPPTGTSPA